jgi:hypothetical protein
MIMLSTGMELETFYQKRAKKKTKIIVSFPLKHLSKWNPDILLDLKSHM